MRSLTSVFRRFYAGSFCILCLLAIAQSGLAQESSDQDLTSLSIEELTQIKVVTASRYLEDPRKAPSPVTIITSDEIRSYGWRTLGEVLRSTRGFYTANDRNYTYLGVHGFLQSGDYNARFLLLINGHRVNENVYDSALLGTEFPIDLDLIDHVEIVRGPSSSLYGTNAVLAVVNVITREPAGPDTFEASGIDGSFLSRQGRLSAIVRKGTFSGLISGSLYRSNGVPRLYYPEFDSPDTNNGIAQNVDGDRYDQGFIDLHHGNLRLQGLYSSRLKIVPTAPYATTFNDPANRTADTRGYMDASYHRRLSAVSDLSMRAYYDAYRFWGSYPYGEKGSPGYLVQINDATADWVGWESYLGHKIGKNRFVVGTDGEYNLRVNQRNYYLNEPSILNDHRNPWFTAVFGEAELNLPEHFTVNLGGRVDYYDVSGVAVSPRIALMYLPTGKTSLKYIFGHAFRAPDAYDQYYVDQVDLTAPSTNIKAEDIESHTLVFEHSFTRSVGMVLAGYSNDLDKIISEEVDPVTGDTHFVNGNGDRGQGVDIELNAKSESGWAARSSYSFVRTSQRITGASLANSPSHLAKLNAMMPLSQYGSLGLEMLYTGVQENYQGIRVPSSWLTNLTVSTKPLWGGWQFSASSYNLFDRKWYASTGPELTQAAVQQDGRTYRFKVSYRLPMRSLWGRK